ncbi:MAG: hypothetical protein ACTII7_12050 [Galactobacter sp.]
MSDQPQTPIYIVSPGPTPGNGLRIGGIVLWIIGAVYIVGIGSFIAILNAMDPYSTLIAARVIMVLLPGVALAAVGVLLHVLGARTMTKARTQQIHP